MKTVAAASPAPSSLVLLLLLLLSCVAFMATPATASSGGRRHITDPPGGGASAPITILTPRDSATPEVDALAKSKSIQRKKQMRIPRSIVHDHHEGENRTCEFEKELLEFLPSQYVSNESGKHLHLLLAVNDNQIAFLINWLALSFELGYLPSHRVLLHFSCHGEVTRNFVENHLLSKCEKQPDRSAAAGESEWRHTIKDRVGTFLDIVLRLDDTDSGAMTFDVDAPWIRDMVSVFDFYSASSISGSGHGDSSDGSEQQQQPQHNYDVISQGVMIDRKDPLHDGKVLVNFGGIFIKASAAGKAVAQRARDTLTKSGTDNSLDFDWPDQDYITHAMLDAGKASQTPLKVLEHLAKDSSHYNDHCVEHPDTCTHVATGVEGTFSLPVPDSSGSGSSSVDGSYMFLPGAIAPNKCEHICSGSTVLFQHCGMSTCLDSENHYGCLEIPEFVLHGHEVEKVLAFPPSKVDFKPAPHGTFDTRTLEYQVRTIRKFVSPKRLLHFCTVYRSICRANADGTGIERLA